MTTISAPRDEIFISYSHKDRFWLEEFQTALKPLVRRHVLTLWDDTRLQAGSKWSKEIQAALQRANVAILLVSKNFLASDFITDHELPIILGQVHGNGLQVFWIPISFCLVEETPLADLQAAHDPNTPLESLNLADRDLALTRICQKIRETIRNPW